jgi:hypothetical protein
MCAGADDSEDDCCDGEEKKTARLASAFEFFCGDFLWVGLRWHGGLLLDRRVVVEADA